VFSAVEDAVSAILTTGRDIVVAARCCIHAKVGFKYDYNDFDIKSAYYTGVPMIVDSKAQSVLHIACDGYMPATEVHEFRAIDQCLDRTITHYLKLRIAGPIHVFKHTSHGRMLNLNLIKGKPTFIPCQNSFPMSTVVVGRCSGMAGVLGWDDVRWKNETRFYAGMLLAQYMKVPVSISSDDRGRMSFTISGFPVSVSGHAMVSILSTLIRGPEYDYGLNGLPDIIETIGGMIHNAYEPGWSWEPSFSFPAWHTWFEIAAGIIAGIRATLLIMSKTGIKISKKRAVYTLLVIRHYWRRIAITPRSSLDKAAITLRNTDTRFSVLRPE